MKKLIPILIALTTFAVGAFILDSVNTQPSVGGTIGTIYQLDQFAATSTPFDAITTNIAGKNLYLPGTSATTTALAILGITSECLETDASGNVIGSGAACGAGGGGSGTVTNVDTIVPTGWTVSGNPITTAGTTTLAYDTGYAAVLTASTTNWNTFYDTPSDRITAGTEISWTGNTLNVTAHTVDSNLTQEEVEDFAGGMWTGNTETGGALTYQDADGTIDFVLDATGDWTGTLDTYEASALLDNTDAQTLSFATTTNILTISGGNTADLSDLQDTDTTLTEEEVEDFVGGMLGGTETGITVTYQDGTNDIDFVTDVQTSDLHSAVTLAGTGTYLSLIGQAITVDPITESDISDLTHTTDTNANTICTGTGNYLDGEGNCDALVTDTGSPIPARVAGTHLTLSTNTFNVDDNLSSYTDDLTHLATAITDGLIVEADFNLNAPTNDYVLTASSTAASGFTWAPSTGVGTVTSVAQTVPTGFTISGSPITGAGTLAIAYDTGYGAILTASTTEWTTAYGWGDHGAAGYDSVTTAGVGLTRTVNDFACDTASGSVFGCLSSANWTTFNNKEVPLTFSGGLTRTTNNIAPTSGYNIPLTASTTNWETAYGWGDHSGAGYISATLTQEQVEDFAGGMLGGTESGLTVTYQDATGDIDFEVDGVLQDLDTLGANAADSEFLVGTGVGALTWESGATARTSLGVDAAGTDNSTDVTLAGTPNYLTLAGQAITLTKLDISDDTNATGGTGITITANSFAADLGTAIDTTEITDGTILEADLKAVDAASDEECLTYEVTTGDFEWQSCGGAGGLFTDSGAFSYLTSITDDLALGGSATGTAPFFFDVSATTTYIGGADVLTTGDVSMQYGSDALAWIIGLDFTDNSFAIASSTVLGTTNALTIAKGTLLTTLGGDLTVSGGDITLGTSLIFSGGDTTSLNLIDAIDATTETTFESALELQSLQGAVTDGQVPNNITIDLATLATTLTITDNEATAENNAILFTAGGALTGGNLNIESDGDLFYTPSTGSLNSTVFIGALTGNASTATALAANGGNCAAGEYALGIDASGAVESCTDAGTEIASYAQPLDAELTTLAGLTETNGNVIFAAGGAWTSDATPAIVGTDFTGTASGLTAGNVTTNANLTGDVTSVGNAATIAAGVIVEADFDLNVPTDGWALTASSTASGGFAWAATAGGAETNSLETTITGIADTEIFIGNGVDSGTFTALTGDISLTNGGVTAIAGAVIIEADLNADEVPADNDILTFDTTGSNFSWQTPAELSLQPLDTELSLIAGLAETTGNVMIGVGGAWASVAQPIIDCTNCTNIPAGSHTGTITWGGTAILESGTAFQFGDATDATLTHTYANTGTNVVATFTSALMSLAGAFTSDGIISGAGFTIGAAAITEAELEILDGATITTAETDTLSDGSNADSLHVHASAGISGIVNADLSGTAGITGANVAADTITHTQILDSDQADTKCIWFEDPVATDDFNSIWGNKTANDFLLTEIWAESDQTVTFMLQVDDGTPADVDSVDLAPAAGEAEDTSLNGDTTVAAGEELDLAITSVANTPTWVSICFTGNWTD